MQRFPIPPGGLDPILLNRFEQLLSNWGQSRSEWWNDLVDPRRDLDDECGYPKGFISPERYQQLHERDPIANRVNLCLPRETFSISPSVYEDEDVEVETPWEKEWNNLGRDIGGEPSHVSEEEWECHPVISEIALLDELCGIGAYGVMLIGLDDGLDLSQPVGGLLETNSVSVNALVRNEDGSLKRDDQGNVILPDDGKKPKIEGAYSSKFTPQKGRRLLYLHSLPEALCPISSWEVNPSSPRYGWPKTYMLTVNDPGANRYGIGPPLGSFHVHWSRVIHGVDNVEQSKVFGAPRNRVVLNRVLDSQKTYGAGGEGYYRGGFPGLSLETHPQLGGDVYIDRARTKTELESYMNGLQRYLINSGMVAKTLAPAVADPTAFLAAFIEAVCIALDMPMRIFLGSERGELASSQDDRRWKRRLRTRRTRHVTPRLIHPTVNRLINLGVLSVPAKGFKVSWPDDDSQTEPEKADVALKKTQAMAQYISGQCDSLMAPTDYLSRVLGMEEHEAEEVVEGATAHVEETGGMIPREPEFEEQKKIEAKYAPKPAPAPPPKK